MLKKEESKLKSRYLVASLALVSSVVLFPTTAAQAADCPASIQNGGFETPVLSSLVLGDIFSNVWNGPGAGTTYAMVKSLPGVDNSVSQGLVWRSTETAVEIQNINPYLGNQYAEIVGLDSSAALYQSVTTVPGVVMDWSLQHRGWSDAGNDTMRVLIGPSLDALVAQDATPESGSGVIGQPTVIADSSTWRKWSGSYTVPAGQTATFFAFNSISSYGGSSTVGNYIDDISFTCAAEQPTDPPSGTEEPLANTGGPAQTYAVANAAAAVALLLVVTLLVYRRRRAN